MKKLTRFRPRVRSKNHSCSFLRPRNKNVKLFPVKSLVRLGSTTPTDEIFKGYSGRVVELNPISAIENSRSKLKMKSCFAEANVPQAEWYVHTREGFIQQGIEERNVLNARELPYPIIAKRVYGFKGKGMQKIESETEMTSFLNETGDAGYYFERFYNFAREYRLHCTADGVFMKWRKLRKTDAEKRWYFNSDNCIWAGVDNSSFNAPVNMAAIEEHCVNAIKAVGLDIGAMDVRVQSKGTINPGFIVLEVNSAPSLGEQGNTAYANEIERIIESRI